MLLLPAKLNEVYHEIKQGTIAITDFYNPFFFFALLKTSLLVPVCSYT
jgi:hypothetical protein